VSSPAGLAVRLAAVLPAAAVLLFGVFVLPFERAAAADPVSSCTPSRGVIVAVDFSSWGGAVQRGCDASPTTGYDALHAAGFSTDGTTHDGQAFICRIDGYPNPAQDPCVHTPPSTAYWSYWHAGPGQDGWSYSSQGAMSYHPGPGSVDAWAFGSGDRPSFPPAAVRAVQSSASTPPRSLPPGPFSTPSAAGSAVDAASSRVAVSRTAGPAGTTSRAPAARTSSAVAGRPDWASSAVPGTSPTPSSSGPQIIDAVPVAQHPTTAGRPLLPVLLTLAAVVLLGGGAGWPAWQRRRRAG
jgi:hypothetical protein